MDSLNFGESARNTSFFVFASLILTTHSLQASLSGRSLVRILSNFLSCFVVFKRIISHSSKLDDSNEITKMPEIWEHEPDLRLGGELNPFVVDDQDDVVQIHDEEEVEEEVAEVIDITDDLEPFERGQGPESRPGEESLPSFLLRDQGFHVRPGITVELREPAPIGKYTVNFLRITSIARQNYTDNVTIRGHGLTRAKNMNGMLAKQLNECCLIALVDTHDPRPWKEQAIIDIKPENVLAGRNFRITNAPFPQYADHSAGVASKRQQVKDMGLLVSRYSYIEYHQTDERKPREWTFLRAGEDEADENFRVSAEVLVNGWRDGKIRGGSHVPVE